MSRMSWQTSLSGTPASMAALRAGSSSDSLKPTAVTTKPRRATSTEWRPNPQGASRTRAPASSAATLTIHSTSLAASVGDSNACEIWGHASRKNRSLWNTAAIVAGSVRPVHSVGGPRRGATRPPSACDIFRLMATLVTGAFGCIGSWVVRDLLVAGKRPVVVDVGDDPWRPRMIAGDDVARRITIVRGDIADRDALVRVVRDHGIRRIVHLAAWQIPLCRQDPSRGALINVVGTANVFEAARANAGRVERVVYASSAAVFGAPDLYPPGPIKDDAPRLPATHYGVYKVANEETARVYWAEHRLSSMGFRPLSVYGPGRDFGVTADPTLAMKSAVLGRAFKIRGGGRTDLVYVEDVARALLAAGASRLDGARVYNLHGASVAIAELVRMIEAAWPRAQGLITHVEQPIPFPAALDDARYQKDLGPVPPTALAERLRKTLDEFARLQEDGRLDARELE